MTAGLPGTGIGGLYYLLLALWSPFHELRRTLSGQGSVRRWMESGRHVVIASGILSALYGEAWALKQVLLISIRHTPPGLSWLLASVSAWDALIPAAVSGLSFTILAVVVLLTHAVRLWIDRGEDASRSEI
jgi:hypothetical protein